MAAEATPRQSQAQAGARESLEFSWLCLAKDLDGGARGQALLAPKISPTRREGENQGRRGNDAEDATGALSGGRSRWGQEAMGRQRCPCATRYLSGAALGGLGERDAATSVAA